MPLLFTVTAGAGLILHTLFQRREIILSILLILSCLFAGSARFSLWQHGMFAPLSAIENSLSCDSILVEIVSVRYGKRLGAIAEIQQVWLADSSLRIEQRIQLYFHPDAENIFPASRLMVRSLKLEIVGQVRNPGGFDYRRWLEMRGIAFVADVRRNAFSSSPANTFSARFALAWLRNTLSNRVSSLFEAREASLLKALWLGQGRQLDADIRADFQRTGLVHVLAVSGLHVGFLLAMMLMFTSLMRFGKITRSVVCCSSLTGFLCITGFQPAVTRAVIMGIIWIVCRGFERNTHPQQVLFLSALIILMCWPQQLFWLGFQLSFSAVFWINFLYRKFRDWGKWLVGPRASLWWLSSLIPGVAVSLAAQIGTAPLIAYHFGELAPLSLLLNIIVLPVIAFLVGAGPPILALADIGWFSTLAAQFIQMLLKVKLDIIHQAAGWDLSVKLRLTSDLQIACLWLLFAIVFIRLPFSLRGYRPTLLLTVTTVLLHISVPLTGNAQLLMLDVGQGDCFLLRLRSGKIILVDTGPANRYFDSGKRIVVPVLSAFGVEQVDRVFISHPHRDHAGGLAALLSDNNVDSLHSVPLNEDDPFLREMKGAYKAGYRSMKRGDWLDLDSETRVYVLGPSQRLLGSETVTSPINNRSLVLLIRHRNIAILFTGDVEFEGEYALLPWKNLLKSQVLKAGHHGSKTSSHPAFLKAVGPEVVLISAGRRNRFRHPSPQTLINIQGQNARALRTDLQGAVWLELKNDGVYEKKWR